MDKAGTALTKHGVGRRKSSVARVWLKPGTGKVVVNGKDYKTYFDTGLTRSAVVFPLKICGMEKNFDAKIAVVGGGMSGQADAVKLGISRALLASNQTLKSVLRQHGLLTVDARIKERKKYGQKAARRRFQFVKR
jgi:small subunit ribosomal protein S9